MITNSTGRGQQHTFTMDVWDQNMNGTKGHTTSVPPEVFRKGFRKQRPSKARWYLIIGVSITIIIVAVVVIALAVHFAVGNDSQNETLAADSEVETFHLGGKGPTTRILRVPTPTPRQHNTDDSPQSRDQTSTSTKMWKLSTRSTQKAESTSPTTIIVTKTSHSSTSSVGTIRVTSTQRVPTPMTKVPTDSQTTKTILLSSLSSEAPTRQVSTSAKTSPIVQKTSVSNPGSSISTTAQSTKVQTTTQQTTKQQTTTADDNNPTTSEPATPSHNTSNITSVANKTVLTFDNSNISLPFNGSPLTLRCVALYANGWTDLKIVRKNGKSRNALAVVTSGIDSPSVYVIDANFSSEISYKTDALMVTLYSNAVDCSYTGEYSCIISTVKEIKEIDTEVHTIDSQPKLEIPTSIVEGGQITLKCSVEVTGQNGTIKWKLRPPGLHTYFDLSLSPTTTKTETECSTTISSVLTFNPQMHDNGSFFRCEVADTGDNTLTQENTLFSEEEFSVVPKSFCEDKKPYSINVHPDSSCNMVIYCFVDGPHVYQIDCDPGSCYDIQKTRCVTVT